MHIKKHKERHNSAHGEQTTNVKHKTIKTQDEQ